MGSKSKLWVGWIKTVLLAFAIAWFIRTFIFQGALVPSSSMENALFPGDFVLITKWNYGARIPMTPLAIPFLHQYIPFTDKPCYLNRSRIPYLRLPGFSEIKRNDVVVFNYPGELERPVDRRTFYVKRCVALPGDTMEIFEKKIIINGDTMQGLHSLKFNRKIVTKDKIEEGFMDSIGIHEGGSLEHPNEYVFSLSDNQARLIRKRIRVSQIETVMATRSLFQEHIFPHQPGINYNIDFIGPIVIPKKNTVIILDDKNIVFYEKIIRDFEKNMLEVKRGRIYINGKLAQSYTFKMDYFFMLGDNRDQSSDSRFWGFVPEDHLIGKVWLTFFSFDSRKQGWDKVRWNRIFRIID